jgi:hypothetical protein
MSVSSDQMTPVEIHWQSVVGTAFRLLTFQASKAELLNLTSKHLYLGLLSTWLVGIGRYWDNPRVSLLQHLGIGSLLYIVFLSFLLWLIIWSLRPKHWSYFRVLTFVSLVSPPAILYAIPVQYFFSLETANYINVIFLAIVATWRVALLVFFLRRAGELDWFSVVIGTLLPIELIIVTLTLLNLERVVFDFMRGIIDPSPNDGAYILLIWLTYISLTIFFPIVLCYVMLAVGKLLSVRRTLRRAP